LTASPITALVLGLTFSFAWTPCIGPVLSGVLVMAASAGTQAQGFLLIGLYTLGFILPFLAVGLFTSELLNFFNAHRNVMKYTVTVGGVLMIAIGIMMITGVFSKLAGTFSVM
jgi:cytochrome c-type biogenesis protein